MGIWCLAIAWVDSPMMNTCFACLTFRPSPRPMSHTVRRIADLFCKFWIRLGQHNCHRLSPKSVINCCLARSACLNDLAIELAPARYRAIFFDAPRGPKITLSLSDERNVRCCRFNFMARSTQYAAVLKSRIATQSVRDFVVIVKVSWHKLARAVLTMTVSPHRGGGFDLGCEFLSHAALASSAKAPP